MSDPEEKPKGNLNMARIENVKHYIVALVLFVATFSVAQEISIKGYRIGESKSEYLLDHPELKAFLNTCHANLKEYAKQKCGRHHGVEYDLCVMDLGLDKCVYLVPGFDGREHLAISCDELSGTPRLDNHSVCAWRIGDDKLSSIVAHFDDYDDILAAINAKAKVAPLETSISFQNGFGAHWVNRVATWKTDVNCATLAEDNDPSHAGIKLRTSLQVESRTACDEREKAAASKGNPLD